MTSITAVSRLASMWTFNGESKYECQLPWTRVHKHTLDLGISLSTVLGCLAAEVELYSFVYVLSSHLQDFPYKYYGLLLKLLSYSVVYTGLISPVAKVNRAVIGPSLAMPLLQQ